MNKPKKNNQIIYILFIITITFFFINQLFTNDNSKDSYSPEQLIQIQLSKDNMLSALNVVKTNKVSKGITIDAEKDPNQTGLIGNEYSMITTTMGHLDAKRTSVNPDMAALICTIFINEGLEDGDSVAIGSSASFPGLLLATLSACKTLNLHPITIVSFGASQYGANETDFTIIEILKSIEDAFGDYFKPSAISYGGNHDIADDLTEEARRFISNSIQNSDYPLIYESDFKANVETRMKLYDNEAKNKVKMFVNIGGSVSNMGNSPEILNLKPGLNKNIENIPTKEKRGVLFEFALRKTPILHLLYMKGLSIRYGLIWDPIPFKEDSHKSFYQTNSHEKERYLLFFFVFIGSILSSIIAGKLFLHSKL
ncbi:MAG: poly-gamma-glutamate system protein [Bacteroidota bacterium]